MADLSLRHMPDAVQRALRLRAGQHERSTEAKIRNSNILESVAHPPQRIKLGSLLVGIACEAGGLCDEEVEQIKLLRDRTPAEPIRFDDG
ncbi:MAG: plasmid stabilization protein [Rhodocyclaceae bacterium]|nr:plasmid stabilization protein [Rhodocyclaceae bacterium]MBR4877828.1 plasmid stabilization protein [Rhodocyclaceae bacterium]